MENNIIGLNNVRFREEDFGTLVNSGGGFHVINEPGIEIIKILQEKGPMRANELVKEYINKFNFDTEEDYSTAHMLCINYLNDLRKRMIVGEIKDV